MLVVVDTLKLSLTYSNLSESDRSVRISLRMRLIDIKAPALIRGLCGFSVVPHHSKNVKKKLL